MYYESIKSLQNGRCQLYKNFNKYVWSFLGERQEDGLFNLSQFTTFVWWPLPAQMTNCFHTGLGDASSKGRACLSKFSPFNKHCAQVSHSQEAAYLRGQEHTMKRETPWAQTLAWPLAGWCWVSYLNLFVPLSPQAYKGTRMAFTWQELYRKQKD